MKLRYRRTGGIVNVVREAEIDSERLPPNWQIIVKAAPKFLPQEPLQSDEFFHELILEDGTKISCTDSDCTPELMALFDQLYAILLTQRHRDTEKK